MKYLYLSVILAFGTMGVANLSGLSQDSFSDKAISVKADDSALAQDRLLRVMAYNIHHANPPSRPDSIDITAIVRTIKVQNPDLVALQEIDSDTERSGPGNQSELIAKRLGMKVFFGKSINYGGGDYGVAILSKFPISEGTVHRLPTKTGTQGEKRVLATVKVTLSENRSIRFGSTHLDSQKEDTNRILQMKEILQITSEEDIPMIIAGDFNSYPKSKVINILDQGFKRTCDPCEPTIPVNHPEKAIDFIAFKPENSFQVISHTVIDETYASDHLPIVAVLQH